MCLNFILKANLEKFNYKHALQIYSSTFTLFSAMHRFKPPRCYRAWNGMTDIDIMLKNSGSNLTIKMRNYGNTFNFPFIR